MANQLRRGEIGEPVELVAQIVQDGPIGLNCGCIDEVPSRKLNLFVLCDMWPSYLWLNYYAFINKRRTLSLL